MVLNQTVLRDLQLITFLLPETMTYSLTPSDRRGKRNMDRLVTFLKDLLKQRRAEVKAGKDNDDLLSILCQDEVY